MQNYVAQIEALCPRSDFIVSGQHRAYLRSLDPELLATLFPGLLGSQLVVIKPEAVAAGIGPTILKEFAGAGMVPFFAAVIQTMTENRFEELYRYSFLPANINSMIGSLALSSRSYGLAPAFLVILRGDSGPGIFERVGSLKGPSAPYKGRPGQLRYDLNAPSRALNLVHASDDPVSTLREWSLFSSFEEIASACGLGTPIDPQVTSRMLHSCGPVSTDADFCAAMLRVSERMMAVCGTPELSAEPDWIGRATDLHERVRACSKSLRGLQARHRKTADGHMLAPLLDRFLDLEQISPRTVEPALAAFSAAGAYISEWDRLMIQTNARYSDDLVASFPHRSDINFAVSTEPAA